MLLMAVSCLISLYAHPTSKIKHHLSSEPVKFFFIVVRLELAKCIANPACAANVACLQTCNNRPDETECQVGSLFSSKDIHRSILLYHGM